MPALIVKDGPSAGHRIDVTGETVLGRADSEFLQHDTEVSRRHAVVRPEPGGLAIEDLGSSNGTFVNERRVEGATSLNMGDVIRLGQTTFEVEVEAGQQRTVIRETVPPPDEPAPAPAPEVTARGEPAEPAEPPVPEAMPTPPAAGPVPPPVQPPPPIADQQPAYAAPPTPPAYGPAQAAPPAYAQPPGAPAFGARPAAITAAAIILIVVGLGSIAYNGYDLVLLVGDLDLLESVGFGGLAVAAIIIDIVIIASAVLQLVGGIRVMGLSRAGRMMAIIGSAGVVAGWISFLVLVMSRGLTVSTLAWAALILSVAGSVVAAVLLLGASRSFGPRY